MTPEQFCYWMQGFVEISGRVPNDEQWVVIQDHLKLVFNKQTPNRNITVTPVTPQVDLSKWPINFDPSKVTC